VLGRANQLILAGAWAVPDPAASAVLFPWSVDRLKAAFKVSLVRETREAVTIRLDPATDEGRDLLAHALVQIDPRTSLPTRYYVVHPNGKDSTDYLATHVRPNVAIDDRTFKVGVPAGWTVMRDRPLSDSKVSEASK
jgi:hypothetical protein